MLAERCAWSQIALGDVITDLRYGTSAKCDATAESGRPVLRIPNVVGEKFDLSDLKYAALSDAEAERFRVQLDDILIVRTNGNPAYIGRSALASSEVSEFLFASYLLRIRCDVTRVYPYFLNALLQSKRTRRLLLRAATTSAGNYNINTNNLRRILIPIPSLEEQQRIIEVLRSLDDAMTSGLEVAEAALQAGRTIRHELLRVSADGVFGRLPDDWEVRPLEALATVERGKFSVRPRNDPRYFGGSTPFIQTGDITAAGDYLTDHTQTLNELGVAVSRVFPSGTIMTTIAANIGDFAIATYPVACPDSVVGIEARDGVSSFWLYSVLSCFKAALDKVATQNAQKNINLQTLRPLLLPTPPVPLMGDLSKTLEAIASVARAADETCRNFAAVRAAVMEDLLFGRVRVPL
jgi:type I restriction enzyme S subunit